jgi:methylated-DNA-protein-cysteine methyltransferase related protein
VAIVAVTGARIAPMTTKQFLSRAGLTYWQKEITTNPTKMPPKRNPSEKLKTVRPSGIKEESFFELVFEVARQIPKGRVTSYGAIAAALGTKLSARMVGWAMNGCHRVKPKVPAHRVVNRNGLLTGKMHFANPDQMQELLEKEGVMVVDDKVVEFKEKFWDPAKEGPLSSE